MFVFTFGGLVACSTDSEIDENSLSEQVVVDILQSSVTIDVFEQTELSVYVKNTDEKLVWESSDTSVAIIDEQGKLFTKKQGTTTIIAKIGDISDSCYINVVSSGTVPVLHLNDTEVDIFLGGKFLIEPIITYKGKVAEGATVQYEILSGNDLITLTDGLVTGTAYGTAIIKLSAEWNDVESISMQETLSVTVKPLITSIVEQREFTLYTAEELGGINYQKSAMLDAKVYENGSEKTVEWYIEEGSDIVTLDGSVVTAVEEGEAKLKYSCQVGDGTYFEGFVNVSVKTPSIEHPQTLYVPRYNGIIIDKTANEGKGSYEWKKNSAYDFTTMIFGDDNNKAVVKVRDISSGEVISNADGTVNISQFPASYDNQVQWAIYSNEYVVNANVVIVDHIISTEEEFTGFMPLIKDGHIVLGSDIDFTSWSGDKWGEYNKRNGAPLYRYCAYISNLLIYPLGGRTGEYANLEITVPSGPFMGTFDGLGHTIKGINLYNSGLFQSVKNATIKNLRYEVGYLHGTSGLITQNISQGNFTMQNVYVKFDLANKNEGSTVASLTHGTNDTITLENCVFDIYDTGASDTSFQKWGMISAHTSISKAIALDNTYFVYNGNGERNPSICVGASSENEIAFSEKYGSVVFATRNEYLYYLKSTSGSLEGFNGYWNISTGEPVWEN